MVGMVVLFLIVVLKLGLDVKEFALGLLPISMPAGSGNIVMSLIGTTGTGFNLFLGGEMARGRICFVFPLIHSKRENKSKKETH